MVMRERYAAHCSFMFRYSVSITPAMPEQMAQSRSMSPLCHAQSTKRVFTAASLGNDAGIYGAVRLIVGA